MAVTLTTPNTVLGVLEPKSSTSRLLTNIVTVIVGTALLTLSAKTSVNIGVVPVSLQTFAVALLAAAFGWRIGVATVALYLIEGATGLPVFAKGGGLPYLVGPTGGFLVGFLPMAYIIGRAADMGASGKVVMLFAAMIVGDAVLFVFGFAWLLALGSTASWLDQNNLVGSAFSIAVQPFILWDILKMALAALSTLGLWSLFKRRA